MTFKEGNIIAEHYQLKKQLGQGSFGDVWLANNLLADIDVAIKFYGTLDQKGIEEFRNEFKIAYKLHHPNLLNISHFDVFENCPYLVMPYCENGSLSHRIGQMPESEIWKFILDTSCGLAFLHSQKPPIVHQDIKPDNILITSDGRYVISDFGISRSFRTQLSSTKNNINSSGTLAYMGPERFSERPMIVLASDIWAFGMTLYEAITGDVLWEGMGGCVQLNGARIPAMSNTTPELAKLVSACLSPETWNRPTAQQIYDYAAAHIQHNQLPPLTYGQQESPKTEPIDTPRRQELRRQEMFKPVTPASTPSPSPRPAPAPRPISSPRSAVKPRQQAKQTSDTSDTSLSPLTKRILIAVAAILGVIVIGAGLTTLFSSFSEEQDFISCKTRQDFEQFIKDHPSSSYVTVARKRIEALTPAENQQKTDAVVSPDAPKATIVGTPVVKEKVEIVTQQAQPQDIPDDRIEILPSTPSNVNTSPTTATSTANQQNDDAVFYACQTIGDYQSYLNTFPQGRHRSQAQAAINDILNRNDNMVNKEEPVINRERRNNVSSELRQSAPPRTSNPPRIRRTAPSGPPRGNHFRRP